MARKTKLNKLNENMMMTKLRKMGLAAACMLLGTHAAEAALVLTWDQVGNDVKATWSGTYQVPNSGSGTSAVLGGVNIGSDILFGYGEANFRTIYPNQGIATPTSLVSAPGTYVGDTFGFWGWNGGNLINKEGGQGTLFAPVGTFTFTNTTLAAMGAASFNNTLAWTGHNNVGESAKVYYETVPEPSVASFGLLGLSAILLQRRRKGKAGSIQ